MRVVFITLAAAALFLSFIGMLTVAYLFGATVGAVIGLIL